MSSLYLFDASAIIAPNNEYFPMDRIVPYWEWLLSKAAEGIVKTPEEIYQEIVPKSRPDITEKSDYLQRAKRNLFEWAHRQDVREQFILEEQMDRSIYEQVLRRGYGENLEEKDYKNMGRDPMLIAYAMKQSHRIVVTKEISELNRKKGNRKIPDVCKDLNIRCINDSTFEKECGFRIPLP